MRRWLFHILAALSLLLAIGTFCLWHVRRFEYCTGADPRTSGWNYVLVIRSGALNHPPTAGSTIALYWSKSDFFTRSISLPLSAIFWPALILPLLWCALWLRRPTPASRGHLCQRCHYDLRAHHPGQNCPECGTPITANAGENL